jgi:hypothetical protein
VTMYFLLHEMDRSGVIQCHILQIKKAHRYVSRDDVLIAYLNEVICARMNQPQNSV